MSGQLLIIVLGAPGTGKTTLARHIAKEFGLPLLVRDDIKEILFDTLGWSDRAWSKKLGFASARLLYHILERFLESGQSLVVESNFRQEYDTVRFAELQDRYHCQTVQVLCEADTHIVFQRFKQRAESGERHPGHVDHLLVQDFPISQWEKWDALDIEGAVLRVDMNDIEAIDYARVIEAIKTTVSEWEGHVETDASVDH